MKKFHILVLVFIVMCSTAFAQRKYVGWSSGYLPNYANFPVSKINWKCYTHVFWFSINPNSSGVVGGLNATTAKSFTAACHQNNAKAIISVVAPEPQTALKQRPRIPAVEYLRKQHGQLHAVKWV